MNHSVYFEALRPDLETRKRLRTLINVLYYDLATKAPLKGAEKQGEILAYYDAQRASIAQGVAYKTLVLNGLKDKKASLEEKRLFEFLSEEILLMEKMPLKDFMEARKAAVKSSEMWAICRNNNDFETWLPYWEECVKWSRKIAQLKMTRITKTPYDALLEDYEPGNTSEYLDRLFAPVKKAISVLLPRVISKQGKNPLPLLKPYSIEKQEKLSLALLDLIHYDMEGGALATSAHPFSADIAQFDARLTTRYDETDWRNNLFTILHEGGHCLQFQNKSQEIYDSYLESLSTAAQCETHSRFVENIIGRSKGFAPVLKKLCAENLDEGFEYMSDNDFYLLLNEVKPGLIRCDADELTYNLHIIIRYEIERDLINGKIECKDVPAIWKKKYKEYLGVDVPNDKMGCMQDMHWSDGSFGYFPSYTLGNLYGAMIYEKMSEDIQIENKIQENDFASILKYLKENDFQYDWMKPNDWIKKVTGKPLSSDAFIRYLVNKYMHLK